MRLRPHRQNIMVWSQTRGPASSDGAARFTRTRQIHRWTRTGALLTVIGLMLLARAGRTRWRPILLLAGGVLTVAGMILTSSVTFILGMLFLLISVLIPSHSSKAFVYCADGPAQLAAHAPFGARPGSAASIATAVTYQDWYQAGVERSMRRYGRALNVSSWA
jgi:hypothetical protein